MTTDNRHGVKISDTLWKRIEKLIKEHYDDIGFNSPSQFIKNAVLSKLEYYEDKYDPLFEEKNRKRLRDLVSGLKDYQE